MPEVSFVFKQMRSLRLLALLSNISSRTSSKMSNQPELKIKGLERKLKQSEIDFMKLIEEQNVQRVLKLKRTRRNNILVGCVLGASVLGIYGYSMFAVQQEKFLDDFSEPAKEEIKQ